MDDSEIIGLYRARSELAVAATDAKYGAYCRAVAGRILPSPEDAEEVVSDAWLRVWNAIPPEEPEHLRAYLGKITRNLALNRLRNDTAKRRGGGTVELALEELRDCVAPGEGPEDALEQTLLTEAIRRFLDAQSPVRRQVFVLRYFCLCPVEEIAVRTGLRAGTVKSMLFRLRKRLKAHLEQEEIL